MRRRSPAACAGPRGRRREGPRRRRREGPPRLPRLAVDILELREDLVHDGLELAVVQDRGHRVRPEVDAAPRAAVFVLAEVRQYAHLTKGVQTLRDRVAVAEVASAQRAHQVRVHVGDLERRAAPVVITFLLLGVGAVGGHRSTSARSAVCRPETGKMAAATRSNCEPRVGLVPNSSEIITDHTSY